MDIFIQDWFNNPSYWFDKNPDVDKYLTNKYEHLLNNEHNNIIGSIILYDQLPRHIFRNQLTNHIIEYFLNKAIKIILNNFNDKYINSLDDNEFTFFLLPLRHSHNLEYINLVIKEMWKRIEFAQDKELIKRFIKATYTNIKLENQNKKMIQRLDLNTFENILDYLDYDKPCHIKFNIGRYNNLPDKFIISLSGGVDSMVLSYIVRKLYPDKEIIALMINYNNRITSDTEVDFVSTWCRYMNITLYVRKIYEINRQQCMKYELRQLYESYTRNIRFHAYKSCMENPVVLLGHNKDDAFENIMTNMTARIKYENLSGMEYSSYLNDINFIRPLLDVPKNKIIEFARTHHISYLENSTPMWSQRGKIRNNIIPVLNSWNPLCVDGIFELNNNLKELNLILLESVKDFYNKFEKIDDNNYKVKIEKFIESSMFWKELFLMFNINVSINSLNQFIDLMKLWFNINDPRLFILNKKTSIKYHNYIIYINIANS